LTAALTDSNNKEYQTKTGNDISGPKSTPSKFSIESESPIDFWTIEYLVDKLFLRLVEVKETVINNNNEEEIHIRKYYEQARELLKWIPVAKPSCFYSIHFRFDTGTKSSVERIDSKITR
jgi:hypothetical protein